MSKKRYQLIHVQDFQGVCRCNQSFLLGWALHDKNDVFLSYVCRRCLPKMLKKYGTRAFGDWAKSYWSNPEPADCKKKFKGRKRWETTTVSM